MTEGPEDLMQIVREDIAALRIEMNQRLDRIESNHANGKEHPKLSLRQQAILIHLCRGESNKQIGRLLELPESTIKVHVREIMHKLVVYSYSLSSSGSFPYVLIERGARKRGAGLCLS
jgi:DNA-binding NarL/FixJ family response regulator